RQGWVGGAREAGWYYRRRSLGTSMRGRFNIIRVVGVVLVALAGVACSGATEKSSIEILDWWKQGGEAEAIGALLDVYKQRNPGVKIVDSSVDGSALARANIRSKISDGDPPDTFQAHGGRGPVDVVTHNG